MALENPKQFPTMNDGADYWYHTVGVNVIPCYSQNKNTDKPFSPLSTYSEWFEKEVDEQTFESWKSRGSFEKGMMITGGYVWRGLHKGQYLGMIDLDNQLAIDEFCNKGIDKAAEITLVEQRMDAKDRAHVYFYTTKPLKKKVLTTKEKHETYKPNIEVKGEAGHGVHIVAPSLHTKGARYEIISSVSRPYATTEDIEGKINKICEKYGIPYLNTNDNGLTPMLEMVRDDFAVYAGENRHREVMRYMESVRIRNPEFSDQIILQLAKEWNKKHCIPILEDNDPVWTREFKSAKKFAAPIIEKNIELKKYDDSDRVSKSKSIIDDTAKLIKSKYSFVTLRETNEILLYDGKIYNKAKAESIIIEDTEKIIENCTTHDRNEVINKIKAQTYNDLAKFDSDPNIIVLDNGILNLETLELMPHTAENLSFVLLPVKFTKPQYEIRDETIFEDIEKNLANTEFYKFLVRSFTINKELRKDDLETVLEIIASPIIKRNIDDKAFMFLGSGNNGKSLALEYVRFLLGEANISRIPLQDISDDKFMRAGLLGKSANIFSDLEAGEMKHTGKIKAITSGEGIEAQEKYKNPFTMYPFAKLLFSCNRFPKIYDQSQGFFRRWMIVKWERDFEGDPERDENLKQKLATNTEELALVFSCLVYLARRLNRLGKFTHSKDWKTTQREWNENADPLDSFVVDYTEDGDSNQNKRNTYRFYKTVMLARGETPLGMGQFSKGFAEYYDELIEKNDKGKTERVWMNLKLKNFNLEEFTGG